MNYTKKSFTIAGKGTKQYADNWERTFRLANGDTTATEPSPTVAVPPACLNCGTKLDDEGFCAKRCFLAHT